MKTWQWMTATILAACTAVFTAMAYAHNTFPSRTEVQSDLRRLESKVDLVLQYYGIKYKE